MTIDWWLPAAEENDNLVAEFLLQLKHSSDFDSPSLHPPPNSTLFTPSLPPRWGYRKNRSKYTAQINTAPIQITTASTSITTGANRFVKGNRRSPTTHLSWSGGAGSSSDGCEESSRFSDLGCRSVKVNESASTTFHSRKSDRQSEPKLSVPVSRSETPSERGFSLPDLNIAVDEDEEISI